MSHTDPPSPKAPAGQAPNAHHSADDNPEVEHEHSDVNIGALIGSAIGLLVSVAIVFGLMYGLLWTFQRQAAKNDPLLSPLARPAVDMPARTADPFFGQGEGPRLITSEPAVLTKQRSMEAETLGTYGWVDEKSGVARIPIDEAKKLILQRGLPTRGDGTADPMLGTRRGAYGEASSGRSITGQSGAAPEQPAAAPAPPVIPKGHGQ